MTRRKFVKSLILLSGTLFFPAYSEPKEPLNGEIGILQGFSVVRSEVKNQPEEITIPEVMYDSPLVFNGHAYQEFSQIKIDT